MKWINTWLQKRGFALVRVQHANGAERKRIERQVQQARAQVDVWMKELQTGLKKLEPLQVQNEFSLGPLERKNLQTWSKKNRQLRRAVHEAVGHNEDPQTIQSHLMALTKHVLEAPQYTPPLLSYGHFVRQKLDQYEYELGTWSEADYICTVLLTKCPIHEHSVQLYLQAVQLSVEHFKSTPPQKLLQELRPLESVEGIKQQWQRLQWRLVENIKPTDMSVSVLLEWFERATHITSGLSYSDFETERQLLGPYLDLVLSAPMVPNTKVDEQQWSHAMQTLSTQLVQSVPLRGSVQERQQKAKQVLEQIGQRVHDKTLRTLWYGAHLVHTQYRLHMHQGQEPYEAFLQQREQHLISLIQQCQLERSTAPAEAPKQSTVGRRI